MEKNKKCLESRGENISLERPRRALCCPFSNLPVPLVHKRLHLFSKVYLRDKNLKNYIMPYVDSHVLSGRSVSILCTERLEYCAHFGLRPFVE